MQQIHHHLHLKKNIKYITGFWVMNNFLLNWFSVHEPSEFTKINLTFQCCLCKELFNWFTRMNQTVQHKPWEEDLFRWIDWLEWFKLSSTTYERKGERTVEVNLWLFSAQTLKQKQKQCSVWPTLIGIKLVCYWKNRCHSYIVCISLWLN